jgi:hypothetical protein
MYDIISYVLTLFNTESMERENMMMLLNNLQTKRKHPELQASLSKYHHNPQPWPLRICTDICIYMYIYKYIYMYIHVYIYYLLSKHNYYHKQLYSIRTSQPCLKRENTYIYIYVFRIFYASSKPFFYSVFSIHICMYMYIYIHTYICMYLTPKRVQGDTEGGRF